MVFSNPKISKIVFIAFILTGLASTAGLAWEGYYYVGTFTGYNTFSVKVIWTNNTIVSNDTAIIRVGLNISNPGIYLVDIHVIKVYTNLNGQSHNYATINTGLSQLLSPSAWAYVNGTRTFTDPDTTTSFIEAKNSETWNWYFSVDVLFDLGFLTYATKRYNTPLIGVSNY
ncbi:MAG: hypothetical protein ACTSUV_03630 [Candidatus Ranarchaeia archaeon]